MWHIYFDETGVLQTTTTFTSSIITDYAYVASANWNATTAKCNLLGEERHGREMNSQTHVYNHWTRHAVLELPAGFALTNLNTGGNGNDNSHAQFGIVGGAFWDEDIRHSIASKSFPASIPGFYLLSSGVWTRWPSSTFPLIYGVGGTLANWNQNSGGTWSLQQVPNNDFVLSHIFITNDVNQPVIFICGQSVYNTQNNARAGALTEIKNLTLTGLPTAEFVPIATLIFQTSNSNSNTPKSRLRTTDSGEDYIDWRQVSVTGAAGTVSPSWGNITGTLASQLDLNTVLTSKLSNNTTNVPTVNNTYDLGSSTFRWNNLYIQTGHVGSLAGTGDRAVLSNSSGQLINAASDITLKENIVPLDKGLNTVLQLNPVWFDWKPDTGRSEQRQIGLIAQEVKQILPEVVDENGDGTLSIDYIKLIMVLINAIKELKNG